MDISRRSRLLFDHFSDAKGTIGIITLLENAMNEAYIAGVEESAKAAMTEMKKLDTDYRYEIQYAILSLIANTR